MNTPLDVIVGVLAVALIGWVVVLSTWHWWTEYTAPGRRWSGKRGRR